MIRVARSDDGIAFHDTHEMFLLHAGAPDLVRLPEGSLVALVDCARDASGETRMAVATSPDEGRSWSPLELIELKERQPKPPRRARGTAARQGMEGHHGDLAVSPTGIRLYFSQPGGGRGPSVDADRRRAARIRSAVTRDGRVFELDPQTRVTIRTDTGTTSPMAVWSRDGMHLFGEGAAGTNGHRSCHYLSPDGKRFERLRAVRGAGMEAQRFEEMRFLGTVVATDEGLRAYVTGKEGICSLTSMDGRSWRVERGVRLEGGWDPAVIRLASGSYLMLYCAPWQGDRRAPGTLVPMPEAVYTQHWSASGTVGARDATGQGGKAAGGGAVARGTDGQDGTGSQAETAVAEAMPPDGIGPGEFAPWPDFLERIDYLQWWREEFVDAMDDNAYTAYAGFLPGMDGELPDGMSWPELKNMFTDREAGVAPGPWTADEHPDWAASGDAAADLLEKWHEATRHEGYAYPVDAFLDRMASEGIEHPMLLDLRLPQLSSHRRLAQATISEAWRSDDGKVNANRMLDALDTCLRNARHLNEGSTLIEELVSGAERELVHRNARWALKRGVFEGDGLQEAFDLLKKRDPGNPDPLRSIRGEHATAVDTVQEFFWPGPGDEEPAFRASRVPEALGWSEEETRELADLGPHDAYEALDAFESYYQDIADQMTIGYPEVRSSDVTETARAYGGINEVVHRFVPDLGRVHRRRAQMEASRRATQLAYATHLFKRRNGRWPRSLGEIAGEYGREMTTDPFTGGRFGYRVTEQGPTIYSLSENGRDDGGTHTPRWGESADGSDDYVFWPPQE